MAVDASNFRKSFWNTLIGNNLWKAATKVFQEIATMRERYLQIRT